MIIINKEGVVMRLTKELPMGSYRAKTIYLEPNRNEQECIYKLGQLEDIEEELGIDLITYVKLTTQPIIYFKNYPFDNEIKKAIVSMISVSDNEPKEYLVWLTDLENNRYFYPLKRYGLNLALTREELL